MIFVGAILRDNLDLRSPIPAIFGVIVICEDLHFLNRVLVGRDNRGAAPGNAGDSHTIDRVVVVSVPRAIGDDLSLILCLENAGRPTRSTWPSIAGQV